MVFFACAAQGQPTDSLVQVASPLAKPPLIIPQPKVVRLGSGDFHLVPDAQWVLRASDRDERLWLAAKAALGANSGSFEKSHDRSVALGIGILNQIKFPTIQPLPRWASDPEGYRLTVKTNRLLIQSQASQGAFYALQTLAQLCQQSGNGRSCPVLEIEDWPALRFRGVHWFPSASGVPMHHKLIEDVLGTLKFNYSVVQCEAAQWDGYPEISAQNAISKSDLRNLVANCRRHFLEPVPLINVPGHAEWIFRHGNHLDFAEDQQTPYAYCVNNPKSEDFIENILSECLPIFESKFCHLGHDEVTMRGRFPNPECARCKNATTTELVVRHANRLCDRLAGQGIQTMIWGDMLLAPGEAADATHAKSLVEARQRRALISTNIIVVDWHYVASADARSIEILRHDGFRVVAASWYTPENIQHLAQAALAAGAEGLLQTTWMGYFPDDRAMQSELRQFTAFVLAAEYAWSGRKDAPSQLGYDPKEAFLRAYSRSR